MPIEFRCNRCNSLLRTPDETAGAPAVCPKCGAEMTVPEPTWSAPEFSAEPSEPPLAAPSPGDNKAIASFLLGICGLCFFCCCPIGGVCSLVGLILGIQGLQSEKRGLAIAGIVLCCLGLVGGTAWLALEIVTSHLGL